MIIKTLLLSIVWTLSCVSGGTVTWTGAGGNGLWSYGPNWNTNVIPTSSDDVYISFAQGVNVTIAAPAYANSLTIGSGTDAMNNLIIQSSLNVESGGVMVHSPSAIVLQAPPASPFTSAGNVNFNGSDTFWFLSGAISGSGAWTIFDGSSAQLIGAGEKLIQGTILYNYGTININSGALVQLEAKGEIRNYRSIVAKDTVTFLSQDGTGTVTSKGTFEYDGNTNYLILQATAYFDTGITVKSGHVDVQAAVSVQGFSAPQATVSVAGNGALDFTGDSDFETLVLQPGAAASSTGNIGVGYFYLEQAKLSNTGEFTANRAYISGGSLQGDAGQIYILNATFQPDQNVPLTLNSGLSITGTSYISKATTILVDQSARFVLATGVMLYVNDALSFQKIGGNPNITLDGDLALSGDLFTNVNINGRATYNTYGHTITLQAVSFTSGDIGCSGCSINAAASLISAGNLIGNGNYNIQADPSASFKTLSGASLVVSAGSVTVNDLHVDAFNLTGGSFSALSSSYATDFHFTGGALMDPIPGFTTDFHTTSTFFEGVEPKTLSAIVLTASHIDFNCGAQCTVIFNNNARVVNA